MNESFLANSLDHESKKYIRFMFHLTLNLLYEIIKQSFESTSSSRLCALLSLFYTYEKTFGEVVGSKLWSSVPVQGQGVDTENPNVLSPLSQPIVCLSLSRKSKENRCSSSKTSLFPRDKWKTIGGRISTRKSLACHRSSSPVNVATIFSARISGRKVWFQSVIRNEGRK